MKYVLNIKSYNYTCVYINTNSIYAKLYQHTPHRNFSSSLAQITAHVRVAGCGLNVAVVCVQRDLP
jgi:hypothetical protein